MICWYKSLRQIDVVKIRNLFFLRYTHINNFNQKKVHLASQPCHIMEPKDVATLKHLSEELQNDREILLHAAALSERDFEGQSMSAIENRCIYIWTYCIDPSRFGFSFKNTHLKNLDDFFHQNPFLHPFGFFFFGSNFIRRSVLQETRQISATRRAGFAARQRWWDGIPTAGSCPKGKSNAPVVTVQLDATCWSLL